MKIDISDSTLIIKGLVENLDDCMQVSKSINKILQDNNNKAIIVFEDSFAIPSTLIGFLLKLSKLIKQ